MSALFEVAREEAPSVVFIDEFDSIALSRGADIDEESRRGLSTLLAELDGLSSKASDKEFVLVIVATNTPDAIGEAIMSRFGKKIEIPLPDYEACKEIFMLKIFILRLLIRSYTEGLEKFSQCHRIIDGNISFKSNLRSFNK